MVASLRNISARSVTIKQVPLPPPPPGIHLRVTSGTMTHWNQYESDFPTVTPITGAYNPTTLGPNGALSNGNLTVNYTGASCVLGNTVVPSGFIDPPTAWEFLISVTDLTQVGFWVDGIGTEWYDSSETNGGNNGYHYYQNNGSIEGPLNSGNDATYTLGDVIGVVLNPQSGIYFYKNGVQQSTVLFIGNTGGWVLAGGT